MKRWARNRFFTLSLSKREFPPGFSFDGLRMKPPEGDHPEEP